MKQRFLPLLGLVFVAGCAHFQPPEEAVVVAEQPVMAEPAVALPEDIEKRDLCETPKPTLDGIGGTGCPSVD